MSTATFEFDGLLWDMDGTLVDSTAGVEGAWATFKEKYPFLNVEEILKTAHGVRTIENFRIHIPELTEKDMESEAERFELEIIRSGERRVAQTGHSPIVQCKGVEQNVIPVLTSTKEGWAICTSATRPYATSALKLAQVPIPEPTNFITAEDVSRGKPSPDPYLLGAKRLGIDPTKCLVFEDAPAGIISGKRAGSKVLGILTSHSRLAVESAGPDYIVESLEEIKLERTANGKWVLTVPTTAVFTPNV